MCPEDWTEEPAPEARVLPEGTRRVAATDLDHSSGVYLWQRLMNASQRQRAMPQQVARPTPMRRDEYSWRSAHRACPGVADDIANERGDERDLYHEANDP